MKIKLLFLTVLVMASFSFAQIKAQKPLTPTSGEVECQMPIQWLATSWSPKSVALIPVSIPGSDRTFYMQFDLGAPQSLLYQTSLNSLDALPSQIQLENLTFASSSFQSIDYGDTLDPETTYPIIGTFGCDLIQNRIAVLDFANDVISITAELPPTEADQFQPFHFQPGFVLLPAKVAGKESLVMYDSGSSAFDFITDQETWEAWSIAGSEVQTVSSNSWGQTLTPHTAPCDKTLHFGDTPIQLETITYMEGTSKEQIAQMKASGMQGMIGNKIFTGHVLVLDFIQTKYAVLKPNMHE